MRLLYLDEAGTDNRAPWMCVAGVLVHGDEDWPEIDRRVLALIDKYIPLQDRKGFVFHATDIFHGSGYLDRRKPEWDNETKRHPILYELVYIIDSLHLPIVVGKYEKNTFMVGVFQPSDSPRMKNNIIHQSALLDCLTWADSWLAKYSPNELATVVHEDGTSSKGFIKRSLRMFRDVDQLENLGLSQDVREGLGLPLSAPGDRRGA